ncbi:MAG: hypothetical protein ACM32O_04765 [Clostridia bacterium]
MLTFEEKLAIIESFPQLTRKTVSLGRVNFQFEESLHEKKNVVYHLHPNGNGFVFAGPLKGYTKDAKGLVNIRDFTADQLRTLLDKVINMLSQPPKAFSPAEEMASEPIQESWTNTDGHVLLLIQENELWNVYDGENLESAFESYKEAVLYLHEEGFSRSTEDTEKDR